MDQENNQMRLDKWLWAARFFKTRALAQKHIELGRVMVNGQKVKNSKQIQIGDELELTLNALPYKLTVMALNHQRRPAPEARMLYQEDEVVVVKRAEIRLMKQAAQENHPYGRPTKKDRRALNQLKHDW